MKLQPGQACIQPLKLLGAQQLEDRQGKPEIVQLNPLQTMVWHIIYLLLLQVSLAKEVGERNVAQRAVYFPVEWTILKEQDQSTRMKMQSCLVETNKKIGNQAGSSKVFLSLGKATGLNSVTHSPLRRGRSVIHHTKSLHIRQNHA